MHVTGCKVEVTSPGHKWLGSSLQKPTILAVLVGKHVEPSKVSTTDPNDEMVAKLRRECREMDIVVLIFEKVRGLWEAVPTEKLGRSPYQVDGALTCNYLNEVRCFENNDKQEAYLKTIGLTIDEQPVGC